MRHARLALGRARSPRVEAALPYISLHLPTSPYISPHLPTSHRGVEPALPPLEQRAVQRLELERLCRRGQPRQALRLVRVRVRV